jgi:outer membrane protein OmpA-like peptidoglycan-associated protein
MACSAAYEKIREIDTSNPKTFQQHLLHNYQQNASFEAEEMHDWDSAKLYSEKALRVLDGENVYPEKISYWKIPLNRIGDIKSGYNNLLSIYEEALLIDPKNLAKAISSLDCWSEQEEEKWQTWDIEKCKNDFHIAMHEIYKNISIQKISKENKKEEKSVSNNITIVTQNEKKEIMQIIYFDFDDSKLSEVSKGKLINFLDKNKNSLSNYIILGHTDTKGSKTYNLSLSLNRAKAVREILLNEGIAKKNVSILGKGELETAVSTPDETKHPANRRAEVKILN